MSLHISDSFDDAVETLRKLTAGFHDVLLVTGQNSFVSSGAQRLVDSALSALHTTRISDFSTNPKLDFVRTCLPLLSGNHFDVVVAIGGGSVIDMAKLLVKFSGLQTPIIAIPTTAGTGAEETPFAVCYEDGVKKSVADPVMLPAEVILFPQLTYSNDEYLTACTAFDALAQAVEGYWSVSSTHDTDIQALIAIALLSKGINMILRKNTSPDARRKLLLGSNLAGTVIKDTRTTMPHAMSYVMTSRYGYPHGHAVALTFPFFFDLFMTAPADRFPSLPADKLNSKRQALRNLLNVSGDYFSSMKKFTASLGLGFDPSRPIDKTAVIEGVNIERAKNFPVSLSHSDLVAAADSITAVATNSSCLTSPVLN